MNRQSRIENALWGLFAGDALSMPVHWYYNRDNITADFPGGITGYEAPRHPHPESFMVGMRYKPDVAAAHAAGRPYDILHGAARFYQTSYSTLEIARDARESEHGNAAPATQERYHYHHGLGRAENTLGAHLVRVLMRSVIGAGRYDPAAFLEAMVAYMTTPGINRDPYSEIYLRAWFEAYSTGKDPRDCAAHQRDVWSIGSHGGMIRPMVVAMLAGDAYQGLGFALEHQGLTHRSENVAGALGVVVPALHALLDGADPMDEIRAMAARIRPARVRGEALFAAYRDAQGPGNIPKDTMWRYHTELAEAPLDLDALLAQAPDAVIRKTIGTACYPEHGLPLMLYLAALAGGEAEGALLWNANAGGDNVNRAGVLGLLVGAAGLPEALRTGLADHAALAGEIAAFAEIAAEGDAL
ncbi:MAG: ADP-ribosylglycohydrolase family protein [Pseudomonadota bacterium]